MTFSLCSRCKHIKYKETTVRSAEHFAFQLPGKSVQCNEEQEAYQITFSHFFFLLFDFRQTLYPHLKMGDLTANPCSCTASFITTDSLEFKWKALRKHPLPLKEKICFIITAHILGHTLDAKHALAQAKTSENRNPKKEFQL